MPTGPALPFGPGFFNLSRFDFEKSKPFEGKIPMAGKSRRTTHRSGAGKKLYAVRDPSGRFKDIQTYERAHRADLAQKSRAEKATTAAKARKA